VTQEATTMEQLAINGGNPVRAAGYPAWPSGDEREIEAVTDVIRSGDWGGFPEPGRYASRFEDAFAAYQGARHGILMANGTITMEVALKALGIGWGGLGLSIRRISDPVLNG